MRHASLVRLLAVAALLAGCGSGILDPPAVHPGSIALLWTIAQGTHPADCAAHGATSLRFSLYDAAGAKTGEWTQDCAAFSTVLGGVAPDDYVGRAQLLDARGIAKTPPADVGLVNVVGGETVLVPVDFPASSFQ